MPQPRRSWKRRSAERPLELREAALRRFSERGYSATTIDDVARAADVTVGTVYRYFPDKRALLSALVEWAISVPLLPEETAPVSLRQVLRAVWTASRGEPHAGVLRILVAEGGSAPDLVTRYRHAVLEPTADRLATFVRQARPDSDGRLAASAMLGHLLGASLLAGAPPSIEGLIPQLDPIEVTVERLVADEGAGTAVPRQPIQPAPTRRIVGPESW